MMVDFKYDPLYKYVVIEIFGSRTSRNVVRKFVSVGGAMCAIPI